MCRPVNCSICGRTTWAGCGQHIAQVKSGVPAGEWCDGQHSAAEKAKAADGSGGWLSRILGR